MHYVSQVDPKVSNKSSRLMQELFSTILFTVAVGLIWYKFFHEIVILVLIIILNTLISLIDTVFVRLFKLICSSVHLLLSLKRVPYLAFLSQINISQDNGSFCPPKVHK